MLVCANIKKGLRGIVNDLLALADETDQQSKYITGKMDPSWSAALHTICTELVQLGHELGELDELLERKKLNESREAISDFCRKANDIANALHKIRGS